MTLSILGCGWLGLALGRALARDGHAVRGSTTSPDKLGAVELAGMAPYLVHLPTRPGEPVRTEPSGFWSADLLVVTVPPPRGVEDRAAASRAQMAAVAAEGAAAGTPWVLYTSSTGVYPKRGGAVAETDAAESPDALRDGGAAVLAAEQALRAASGVETTVLRLAGLYGPGRPPGRFLAGRTDLPGGHDPVNLVHRDDIVAAVQRLVALAPDEPVLRRETFNLCADEHPTREDFYPAAAQALGLEPPTFAAESGPPGHVVQNERAKTRLGLRFRPLGYG